MIARLNLGGPAHQVALLSGRRLDPARYETLLVHGTLPEGERSAAHLAEREGARTVFVPSLRQPISPGHDARATARIASLIRRFRPHVVHSHTAKAGLVARGAALTVPKAQRPKLVHTFHGHVLEGYFGPAKSGLYRRLERGLAFRTDVLVGVSDATVADLVRLGVAPAERFRTIRLGLDLEATAERAAEPGAGERVRDELGLGGDDAVIAFVGRLAPIKRVDRLIEAFAIAHRAEPRCRLLIVGDGEERSRLEGEAARAGVAGAVRFAGYRDDVAGVLAAADCIAISSDNEGTPVSLIEGGACGVPGAACDVGGVREVLGEDAGLIVPAGGAPALGAAMARLAAEPDLRRRLGAAAQERMPSRYGIERLLADVDALYSELRGAAYS